MSQDNGENFGVKTQISIGGVGGGGGGKGGDGGGEKRGNGYVESRVKKR